MRSMVEGASEMRMRTALKEIRRREDRSSIGSFICFVAADAPSTAIAVEDVCPQCPGSTKTFGLAGSVALDTTTVGTSARSTSKFSRARSRKRASVI